MTETRRIQLHLGKCIEDLDKLYNLPDLKTKRATLLCKSAQKLFDSAEEAYKNGDEEYSYVYYMKYLRIIAFITKDKEYQKDKSYFNNMLGSKNPNKAIDAAEKLKNSLIERKSANMLEQGLPPASKPVWAERASMELIVMLDWSSTAVIPGKTLHLLKTILLKGGAAPPLYRPGRYAWSVSIEDPALTTNPRAEPPRHYTDLDDMLGQYLLRTPPSPPTPGRPRPATIQTWTICLGGPAPPLYRPGRYAWSVSIEDPALTTNPRAAPPRHYTDLDDMLGQYLLRTPPSPPTPGRSRPATIQTWTICLGGAAPPLYRPGRYAWSVSIEDPALTTNPRAEPPRHYTDLDDMLGDIEYPNWSELSPVAPPAIPRPKPGEPVVDRASKVDTTLFLN
ncbi:unnamed protein product [Chilo suppressalis]|uniref:USP8 dimerisation domain-containing protein n=1 Tax=Chilo suppressalis TaxID=168631 RepID=A0ABN8B6H0_CHISP|nr:unnamed protein product [Chilo suppressalis]